MDTNKYTQALGQLDACRGVADARKLHNQLNGLLAYLHKNFPAPEASADILAEADKIIRFSAAELELSTRASPPDMTDAVYPIALLRLGMYVYRLPVNPARMTKFAEFHRAYRPLILSNLTPHPINPKTAKEAQNDIAANAAYKVWKDTSPAVADLKQKLDAVKKES